MNMESIFLIDNRICLVVMKTLVVIYLRMEMMMEMI
jgi:hypothetical protein